MPSLTLKGCGPSGPADGIYVKHFFTGINGTALPDSTPDIDVEGNGWQVGADGVFEIQSNKAQLASGNGASYNNNLIDPGVADYTISVDAVQEGTGNGLICRASDGDNNLEVYGYPTDGKVYLIKNDGGSRSVLASAAAGISAAGTYTFKVILSGTGVIVEVDDVEKINTTEAFNQSETGGGLWTWAVYAYKWDNFLIEE